MGSRRAPQFGLCLFEDLDSELAPQGTDPLESSFSQAGPHPGICEPADPASRWRPYMLAAQSVALSLITLRPGYVRQGGGGAAVAYRLASDSDDEDYRGWSPPNLLTDWTAPPSLWSSGFDAAIANSAIAAHPTTGVLVVIVGGSAATARTHRYDPRTETWSVGYAWPQGLPMYRALAYDPEVAGRLLLWAADGDSGSSDQIAYYSDDDGDSWTLYSVGGWDSDASGGALSIGVAPGIEWLAASFDALHYSDTRGVTWTETEDVSTHGAQFQVLRLPGAWLVLYRSDTDNYPCARLLTSARSSFADAEEIVIEATACGTVRGVVDDDGRIWVFTAPTGAGQPPRDVHFSATGTSWAKFRWGLQHTGSASGSGPCKLVASSGRVWLLTVTSSSGGSNPTTNELHLLSLGGWGTTESGSGLIDSYRTGIDRHGWGNYSGPSPNAEAIGTYLPYDEPSDVGGDWTDVDAGSGGAMDLTVEAALEVSTASTTANGKQFRRSASGSLDTQVGWAKLHVIDGGANVGTAGSPLSKASANPELSDGAYRYRAQIRLGADGVRVVDSGSTNLGLLALDGTALTHLRWHLTKGKIWVWARQSGTKWQPVCSGATVPDDGASAVTEDRLTWGNDTLGSSATTSYWQAVGAAAGGAWHEGIDAPADLGDSPADRVLGLRFGRALAPGTYPVPDATASDESLGRLGATGGPTYTGELVELPVAYTHGIEQCSPFQNPSPWTYWESTDGSADQEIVWDAGADHGRYRGGALALVVQQARIATALFRIEDGAGGWTTLGTLDLGVEIDYTLDGDTLIDNGTGRSTRYYREDELKGGWVAIEVGAGLEHREIVGNSAGYLDNTAGQQNVRIRLAGIDGTETASGVGRVYHHSGVLVVYPTTEQRRRALSVVIEDLGVDNDVSHRAGILYPGRVVGIGINPGWDWSRTLRLERSVERALDGTPVVVRRGPSREVWGYSWVGGVPIYELRDQTELPDYVAVNNGLPIGTEMDAWGIWDLLDSHMQSGQVPCVVVPELPSSSSTLLAPDAHLYGTASADSYGVTGIAGLLGGTGAAVRVDGLTVEGYGRRRGRR